MTALIALMLGGALTLSLGCSSEDRASAAPEVSRPDDASAPPPSTTLDAGTDSVAAPTGADGAVVTTPTLPTCGSPPYQTLSLLARDVMRTVESDDLAGVTVTLKACPGKQFPLGASGRARLAVARGAETWIRFEASGYLPWIVGEVPVTATLPAADVVASMVPRAFADTLVPGYDPSLPLVYVQVEQGRADSTAACHSPADVALSVVGHPEASVLYRAMGSASSYGPAIGTTVEGVALITNLPPTLTEIALTASKPGCTYVLAYGDANSPALLPIVRTPLAPGGVTQQIFNPAR